jgi:calcium channel MID1
MPLPKLSPLQSRLAASLIASITLLILYFAFASPHFAYAADVDSIRPEDHNHERLLAGPFLDLDYDELELREVSYEPEFVGVDRGITPRATDLPVALVNNRQDPTNIQLGQTVYYMFSNSSLWADQSPLTPGLPSQITLNGRTLMEMDAGDDAAAADELKLRSRQTTGTANRTLYITVTACDQPSAVSNTTTDPPPQLQLYVSQSADNTNPGPTSNSDLQDMVTLVGGYALYTVNATGNVFIGVYGVNNSAYSGVWSAQIAASIDAPYHYYWNSSDPNLFLVDSDTEAALFYTDPFITNDSNKKGLNTTLFNEWMSTAPPFVMFANDASNTAINGIQNSYCGLQNHASISQVERAGQTTSQVVTEMTSIGDPALPKQQFYMNGLSPGTSYNVILAMNGNSTDSGDGVVGGGGQVFHMANFTTATGIYPRAI